MRNNKNIKNMQNNKGAIINRTQNKAITLISLVITIVILIVLAGVAINLTVGQNGIFTKAKEAKRLQIVAEAKEKIGTDILSAQVDATERNEELEQTQIEDIISKYGELQSDGDTIILKDNGYEISLLDIYNGTITTTGSYSELKAKVELLEKQLEDASKSQSEASKELTELKTILSGTTVTEDKILKDYTAYKDGKLIIGTMPNYAGQTIEASATRSDNTNTYLTIPQAGYYDTNSKISTDTSSQTLKISEIMENFTWKFNGETGYATHTWFLDISNKKVKSITIDYKRNSTYGYVMYGFGNVYATSWPDVAFDREEDSLVLGNESIIDNTITIDISKYYDKYKYFKIVEAHNGNATTLKITDGTMVR